MRVLHICIADLPSTVQCSFEPKKRFWQLEKLRDLILFPKGKDTLYHPDDVDGMYITDNTWPGRIKYKTTKTCV